MATTRETIFAVGDTQVNASDVGITVEYDDDSIWLTRDEAIAAAKAILGHYGISNPSQSGAQQMTTIYNHSDLRVIQGEDTDVDIYNFGQRVITMTAVEFDAICRAWVGRDINPPQPD